MKILITCYYHLIEALNCAATSLEKLGHTVIGYPLYRYYADTYDKDDKYIDKFNSYIKESSVDIILWWYFGIPIEDMHTIVTSNTHVRNFMFNWDEPYNWSNCSIKDKAKFFECVFVTSAEKLQDYIIHGTQKAYLQFPGYSPDTHYTIIDEVEEDKLMYECDISICCTNLYEDIDIYPNQYIRRKDLIDALYKYQDVYKYTFHIYGPETFKTLYPNSYKGFIKYEDTNKLFNYSKINICTHVQYNTYKYLNERVITILGAGGLLLVDKVLGIDEILEPNKECIILDQNNYIYQILDVLNNYEKYYIVRFYGKEKSKQFTWDSWAQNINSCI